MEKDLKIVPLKVWQWSIPPELAADKDFQRGQEIGEELGRKIAKIAGRQKK